MFQQPLNSAESLQDAFQVFNELSQSLTRSYLELEAQVSRLTHELAAARGERLKTLTEKENLANRLQRLLEALPGGVLVTDGDGVVVEHNPAAVSLLGTDLTGRCWRKALEEASLADAENPHQRELRNGKTVNLAVRSLGEEAGHIVLLSDVSEMRALQELVNQQKRLSALGEMVASLAHQVRTPLAAALLYTSHLGNDALGKTQRERFAAKLTDRLHYMERQVNDMLAFARMGKLSMEKIAVDGLLEQLLDSFEPSLAGKPCNLHVRNKAKSCEFYGNQDALLGILLNLLNNASEAISGKQEGEIELRLEQPAPGWLRIGVADNGPGIPEDIRGHIFEPFFTTRANGTGLGLAIVECVVRAHGGRVSCHSTAGLGASFQLDFPANLEHVALPSGFSGQHNDLGVSQYGNA